MADDGNGFICKVHRVSRVTGDVLWRPELSVRVRGCAFYVGEGEGDELVGVNV